MARKPAASASAPASSKPAAQPEPAKGSRAAIILAMISRKRGCSAPEVAEKFGLTGGCTELANARKRANFKIRSEQDGDSSRRRYFRA
jgi:hypothetical protein